MKRDFSFGINDNFLVFIDTFDDKTTGFSFGANAAGAQWDGQMSEGAKVNLNWDNKWESSTSYNKESWIWEAAIPFKSIRYKNNSTRWGINFSRLDLQAKEKSAWESFKAGIEKGAERNCTQAEIALNQCLKN